MYLILLTFFQKERCPNVFVTEFGRVEGDHKNKGAIYIVEGLILIRPVKNELYTCKPK